MNLVWPTRCLVCGGEAESYFCAACKAKVALPDEKLRCPICGRVMMLPGAAGTVAEACAKCRAQKPAFDKARTVTAYRAPVSSLVARFKYNGATYLAPDFTDLLEACVKKSFAGDLPHTVCPVPLYAARFRHRGYNQADYLSRGLAWRMGTDHEPELLRRMRPTLSQTTKNARERHDNLAGVFQSPPELRHRVYGRNILLVDDVMTTGSTFDECAAALKANGAAKIYAIAVCGN